MTDRERIAAWGPPQVVTEIAPGILCVSSAGHGGIVLSDDRNAMVSRHVRRDSSTYEEDVEWCIPYLTFLAEFRAFAERNGKRYEANRKTAAEFLQNYFFCLPEDIKPRSALRIIDGGAA